MAAGGVKNNGLKVIEAIEYGDVELAPLNEIDWEVIRKEGKASRLGLQKKGDDVDARIKVGDYVGLVWLPTKQQEKLTLRVNPKFENMDYYAMYLECMSNPEVSQHMKNCFYFWQEQPLIKVAKRDVPLLDSLAPFAALAFLRELYDMMRRNMRTNFVRTARNLTGRIKGRILMSQQVKRNLLVGRMDRNYCEYSETSNDCRENRILLAALEQSVRVLDKNELTKNEKLWHHWARTSRSALEGVRLQKIHNRDYANIHYTGTFVHYKRPHALARLILNDKDLDPSRCKEDHTDDDMVKVVPFALCTFELFERYTEVKLRESLGDKSNLLYPERNIANDPELKDGDSGLSKGLKGQVGNDRCEMRVKPDFLIPADNGIAWILDSKYKRPEDWNGIAHEDFRQIALYASHDGVLKRLKCIKNDFYLDKDVKIRGVLVYPDVIAAGPYCMLKLPSLSEDSNSDMLFTMNESRLPCPKVSA